MPDWLLVTLFVGLPLLIPTLGLLWLHRRAARRPDSSLKFYHLSIGGSRIAVSGDALAKIALFAIPILWLDQFVPFVLLSFGAFAAWAITRSVATRAVSNSTSHSQEVLRALREMQQQIEAAKSHIETLASEVHTRQIEVEETEKLRSSLRQELETKLKEVEAWQTLSEQQKSLFVQAANEAMRKRTTFQMLAVVVGSIVLNLAASVIWSLMGSPGQKELLETFERFRALVT